MDEIKTYKDLTVWQKSMMLAKNVYSLVKTLPAEERYALSDQMRRSVVSIPSNIAEGYERQSTKDYIRFLAIANASRAELMTQLELIKMIGYADDISQETELCSEVGKMLTTLIKKLSEKDKSLLTTAPKP